jgi:Zn-dependent peptidase ImmA (M78 family)
LSKDFIIIIGLILCFGVLIFINVESNTRQETRLIELNSKIINLDNGLNYLYTQNTNLTTSFEEREGQYPVGSYNGETGNLILITKNLDEKKTCLLFLHELGHKNCYPDLSEDCANDFRTKNLWRCK